MIKIKLRKIKKREWILLSLSLVIVLAVIMDKIIQKTFVTLRNLDQEIAINEKALYRLKTVLSQSKELNTIYAKIMSTQRFSSDPDNILQEIEKIAQKLNLNILNIKPTIIKDQGAYKIYSIRIESQDDIKILAKFLHILIEDIKGIGVERFQINAADKDEPPKISLLINAIAFKEL